jgi:predicted phage terminase large subunit-like protein
VSSQIEQRKALAPLARQELARRRLQDFAVLLVPDYVTSAHTIALCEHLEALERREITRLLVTMPPRHAKSLHCARLFPSWYLGRRPTESIVIGSYGAELAEAHSRRARGFMLDPAWPFPGVSVSPESAAVNRWATTRGGGVLAVGRGGGVTGHGAHLLVVDDPVRDREDADSQVTRESTWAWWREALTTRLMPGAVVLLVQTKWHQDDLAGRVLHSPGADQWTQLSLPALAEEDGDPLGRTGGEALWPEWYPRKRLETLRQEIGERAFLALYQQRPTSEKGGIFRREWMTGTYAELPPSGVTVIQSVDSAFKTGVANDYSVIATWMTDGRFYYLADILRKRLEFPDLVSAIRAQASVWSPSTLIIEDTASAQSAVQQLRRDTSLPIVAVPASGTTKISRAEAISVLFESGRVLLPAQDPSWLPIWIEEHIGFPSAKFDDQVDTTSMALARLRRHSGTSGASVDGDGILGLHERLGDGGGITTDTQF